MPTSGPSMDSEAFLTALDSLEVLTNHLADSFPEADSVTIDPHKMGYVPYAAGQKTADVPSVSDAEYDKLYRELVALEAEHPELVLLF